MLLTGDWRRRWRFALALLTAATAVAGGEPVRLSVTAPAGLRVRPGGVAGVRVVVETTAPLVGHLQVASEPDQGMTITQPVTVGGGRFQYEFALPVGVHASGPLKIWIRLVADGQASPLPQVLLFNLLADPALLRTLHVGWVGLGAAPEVRRPTSLAGLHPDEQGGWGRWGPRPPPTETEIVFTALRPAGLPTDWRLYLNHDVVAVAGALAGRLTAAQAAALDRWVRAGGRLVLEADGLPAIAGPHPLARELGSLPAPVGTTLARCDHGLGEIVVAAWPRPPAADRRDRLWEDLCRDAGLLALAERSLPAEDWTHYYTANGQVETSERWPVTLERWAAVEPIALLAILALAGAFVLVAGVGERLVLARLNRRHWTWVATPLLVAVFAVAANSVQRLSRGYDSRLTQVAVHDYAPTGGGVHRLAACLIPARGGWHPLRLTPETGPVVLNAAAGGQRAGSLALDGNGYTAALAAPVWAPVFIGACAAHADPAPMAADLRLKPGGIAGTVTWRLAGVRPVGAWLIRPDFSWYADFDTTAAGGVVASRWAPVGATIRSNAYGRIGPWPALPPKFDAYYRQPPFLPRSRPEHRQRRGWYGGSDGEPVDEAGLAALVQELATPRLASIGGVTQLPISAADHHLWVAVVADAGPALAVTGGSWRRQETHLYRQLVRLPASAPEVQP